MQPTGSVAREHPPTRQQGPRGQPSTGAPPDKAPGSKRTLPSPNPAQTGSAAESLTRGARPADVSVLPTVVAVPEPAVGSLAKKKSRCPGTIITGNTHSQETTTGSSRNWQREKYYMIIMDDAPVAPCFLRQPTMVRETSSYTATLRSNRPLVLGYTWRAMAAEEPNQTLGPGCASPLISPGASARPHASTVLDTGYANARS